MCIRDSLLGFDESRFKVTTAVAGGAGTVLAAIGLLNMFQSFLSLMSAIIPPLAGVIIAAYWVIGKGKRENFELKKGLSGPGLAAYLAGAFIACITGGTFAAFPVLTTAAPWLNLPFFVGPINGIAVSFIIYIILAKLINCLLYTSHRRRLGHRLVLFSADRASPTDTADLYHDRPVPSWYHASAEAMEGSEILEFRG